MSESEVELKVTAQAQFLTPVERVRLAKSLRALAEAQDSVVLGGFLSAMSFSADTYGSGMLALDDSVSYAHSRWEAMSHALWGMSVVSPSQSVVCLARV